jgi:hypothetical protein
MMSVIMLSVTMLSVVILSVLAPYRSNPICLPSEEVVFYANLEVLMVVNDICEMIAGCLRQILGQQLRPHPIY